MNILLTKDDLKFGESLGKLLAPDHKLVSARDQAAIFEEIHESDEPWHLVIVGDELALRYLYQTGLRDTIPLILLGSSLKFRDEIIKEGRSVLNEVKVDVNGIAYIVENYNKPKEVDLRKV